MAADAYLKVAASQLQQAATAVKQDADQIRAEFRTYKHQADSDISSLQTEIKVRQVEADRMKDNPAGYSTANIYIQKLQKDMENKKLELSQRTSEADQQVRGKEGAVQGIMSQAQGIQRQAGDPQLK